MTEGETSRSETETSDGEDELKCYQAYVMEHSTVPFNH